MYASPRRRAILKTCKIDISAVRGRQAAHFSFREEIRDRSHGFLSSQALCMHAIVIEESASGYWRFQHSNFYTKFSKAYRVELWARANFSDPTFEDTHEARVGQTSCSFGSVSCSCNAAPRWAVRKRALSVASSLRSELSAKGVIDFCRADRNREAQWPIGYGAGLRIKRSSVRIRPWPLQWVLGQGSLLPLSQGEAFTLASVSYLAILVKYILAKKKKIQVKAG